MQIMSAFAQSPAVKVGLGDKADRLPCVGLKHSGLTVFMVTHDPVSAARADRTLHIEDGVLQ
jgi:predicted ABC-type transport system involved in lysophospholipase L1 biosynthesis ATPase subunit